MATLKQMLKSWFKSHRKWVSSQSSIQVPSFSTVTVPTPETSTSFTAPCDGWFCAEDEGVDLTNIMLSIGNLVAGSLNSNGYARGYIPCKKGVTVLVYFARKSGSENENEPLTLYFYAKTGSYYTDSP